MTYTLRYLKEPVSGMRQTVRSICADSTEAALCKAKEVLTKKGWKPVGEWSSDWDEVCGNTYFHEFERPTGEWTFISLRCGGHLHGTHKEGCGRHTA